MLRPITPFCTNFFLISSFLPRILGSISSPFRVEFHYPLTPPSYSLAIHHLTPSVAAERKSNQRLEISELKNIRGGTPSLPSHDDLEILPGKARLVENVFGWGRKTVQLELNEHRTGIICWGMQSPSRQAILSRIAWWGGRIPQRTGCYCTYPDQVRQRHREQWCAHAVP